MEHAFVERTQLLCSGQNHAGWLQFQNVWDFSALITSLVCCGFQRTHGGSKFVESKDNWSWWGPTRTGKTQFEKCKNQKKRLCHIRVDSWRGVINDFNEDAPEFWGVRLRLLYSLSKNRQKCTHNWCVCSLTVCKSPTGLRVVDRATRFHKQKETFSAHFRIVLGRSSLCS